MSAKFVRALRACTVALATVDWCFAAGPLPSWNDGMAKAAILRIVEEVTTENAQREFACDRQSPIGRLDKAWDKGQKRVWTIVDMKRDWKRVFPSARN
jgi:hypothetical protein